MKKSLFYLVTVLMLAFFSLPEANAQDVSVSGGVGYGSKSEDLNLNVGLSYDIPNTPVRLAWDVGYSKPAQTDRFESNLNVHLKIIDTDVAGLYGLTGLNVMHFRSSFGNTTITDTEFGINAGAGAEVDISIGKVFGEAKYVFDTSFEHRSELILGGGVRVNI